MTVFTTMACDASGRRESGRVIASPKKADKSQPQVGKTIKPMAT